MGEKASNKEQLNFKPSRFCIGRRSEVFTKFSAQSDQTDESIHGLNVQRRNDRRIDEIKRAEQLEPLTVDEEMELCSSAEEVEQLNSQYKSLLQEKKQADKMKAEKKNGEESFKKAKKKVQDTDWETRRTAEIISFMGCNLQTPLWQRGGISYSKYRSEHALLRSQKRQKTVSFPSWLMIVFSISGQRNLPVWRLLLATQWPQRIAAAAQDEEFFDAEGDLFVIVWRAGGRR